MDIYVARQPIFDTEQNIFGYELLFRDSMENYFPDIDGDTASSKLLSNSFFSIGMEKITGSKNAFINFTQNLLIEKVPTLFPKEKIVVEILEDVEPTKDVVAACSEINEQGYIIALDDFVHKKELAPLIKMADIIKFDFMQTPIDEMALIAKKLSGFNLSLLAEKVETKDEFKTALEMGFKYFQGYFFSKPEILSGKEISGNRMNLLQIMTEANKPEFEFEKLEKIIERDVAISYKLMRYINSAYYKRVHEVSSISQAIVILGEKGVRQFISLIAMSKLADDKPDELIRTSIIRAKFCELLAGSNGGGVDPTELFTLGLFSMIDAILDNSMENLMKKLPLSESIKNALIEGKGPLKEYLDIVRSYESGDWEGMIAANSRLNIDEEQLPDHYMEALEWADRLSKL